MKRIWSIAALAACAMLTGCGERDSGGVTAEESRELDNAAEMLDASPDSLVASNDVELGNGEEPVALEGEDSLINNGALPPAQ
jgi:hypothetical protein